MFANAEVEVSSTIAPPLGCRRHEMIHILQRREAAGGEVGRAANKPWNSLADHVQAVAGRLASRLPFGIGWELFAVPIPALWQLSVDECLEMAPLFGELGLVVPKHLLPFLPLRATTASHLLAEVLCDLLGHQELLIWPVVNVLRRCDLLLAEGGAVGMEVILHRRSTPGDVGVHHDHRRPLPLPFEAEESSCEGLHVVCIPDAQHIPAVSDEAGGDVFRDRPRCVALNRDLVVVPNPAEVVKLEVPCQAGRLRRDSLLEVAVAGQGVDAVSEEGKVRLVELCRKPLGGNGHAYACRHALS
mmetsp:Transcript_67380/g.157920  ORF Transcript_67380/g.157920 Transcript_67380/m.157920 type:complete len:301 (-) Transcript_67380:494-1396(-)